jgi:hypothetical protein
MNTPPGFVHLRGLEREKERVFQPREMVLQTKFKANSAAVAKPMDSSDCRSFTAENVQIVA